MKNKTPLLCLSSTLPFSDRGRYFLTQTFWPRVFNVIEICGKPIPPPAESKPDCESRLTQEIKKSDIVLAVIDWPIIAKEVAWAVHCAAQEKMLIVGYRDDRRPGRFRGAGVANIVASALINKSGGFIASSLDELVEFLRQQVKRLYAEHVAL